MATTTAHQSVTTKVNDGGTVVKGGNPASDSPMTKNLNLNELKTGSDYGSKVKAMDGTGASTTDPDGVQAAKSAGTGGLAYSPARGERNFIIRAAGSEGAGKINNDASTLLTQSAAENANVGLRSVSPLHAVIADRKVGSAADVSYDILAVPSTERVPGFSKGTGAGNANTYENALGGDASFDASGSGILPTRAVPGELTYHFGGLAKPTTDEYKARDSQE